MKQINIALVSIRITLIALALSMVFFIVPLILDLMEESTAKIIAMKITILYGLFAATFIVYLASRIKIPK